MSLVLRADFSQQPGVCVVQATKWRVSGGNLFIWMNFHPKDSENFTPVEAGWVAIRTILQFVKPRGNNLVQQTSLKSLVILSKVVLQEDVACLWSQTIRHTSHVWRRTSPFFLSEHTSVIRLQRRPCSSLTFSDNSLSLPARERKKIQSEAHSELHPIEAASTPRA